MPNRPLITFEDVTLRLGERLVFEHTSWRIGADEQWAVIGANASGKSTLVRSIRGEVPVVGGELTYHFAGDGVSGRSGRDTVPETAIGIVSVELHRRLVARAIEYHQARWSPVEPPHSPTARDVILAEAPTPSLRRLRGIIDLLGIAPLLDRQIPHLSNGEMRKVLIARAIAARPRLLILDNPLAGLDTRSRRTLRAVLTVLMAGGMRVLMVTQRPDEIASTVTHLLYVEDFRAAAMGPKRALLRKGVATRLEKLSAPTVRISGLRPPKRRARPRPRRGVLVRIRKAGVVYGGVRILGGVDWTIEAGQNWLLLGPNGSGKSTLLSLILGDNPQCYSNDVEAFGMRRGHGESTWDIRRQIGWMSPELQYHYPDEVTCYGVVCSGLFGSIGLYQPCSPGQQRTVRAWMRGLGLADLADRPFGALSDGQQRMALLARAVVKEPPLLILDEPCQGLDAPHRRAVLAAVDLVQKHMRSSVIYVTHHADEIPRCITHQLRMRKGAVSPPSPR